MMFDGGHFDRIVEFLICTQNNGLNFSLQDLDFDGGLNEEESQSKINSINIYSLLFLFRK